MTDEKLRTSNAQEHLAYGSTGYQLALELTRALAAAWGIPVVLRYPGDVSRRPDGTLVAEWRASVGGGGLILAGESTAQFVAPTLIQGDRGEIYGAVFIYKEMDYGIAHLANLSSSAGRPIQAGRQQF